MHRSRWAVSMAFFVNAFLLSNYIARLPDLQEKYAINYQEIGFVLLASAIGSLIAMPFTGALIVKFGSKKITIIALSSLCVLVALFVLSPYYTLLLILFFFIGMASGMTDVAMNAQAVVVEKKIGSPIMSTFHGIWSLGLFSGAGIGSLFIAADVGMLTHFSVIGGISLITLTYFYADFVHDRNPGEVNRPLFQLPSRALIGIGIVAFCAMLGEGAMADWSTIYMKDEMGLTDQLAPSGLVAYSFAMLMARFAGDHLRSRLGDRNMIQSGGVLCLIGMALIISSASISVTLLGFLLTGLGLATIVPIAYSRAGNTEGISPGVGISMVTTIGYSGFIIGPPVIGFIAEHQSLQTAFTLVSFLFVLMLVISLRIR